LEIILFYNWFLTQLYIDLKITSSKLFRAYFGQVDEGELDWLLYNKPLEYAQMVLKGEVEHYLSLGCDHGRLEDQAPIKNTMPTDLWFSP